jgi:hypothetical protein
MERYQRRKCTEQKPREERQWGPSTSLLPFRETSKGTISANIVILDFQTKSYEKRNA